MKKYANHASCIATKDGAFLHSTGNSHYNHRPDLCQSKGLAGDLLDTPGQDGNAGRCIAYFATFCSATANSCVSHNGSGNAGKKRAVRRGAVARVYSSI